MKKLSETFKLLLFMLACMVLCGTKAYAASFTLPAQGETKIMNVPGIEMIRFNAVSADENAENIKII